MKIVNSNSAKQWTLTNGKEFIVYNDGKDPIKLNLGNGSYAVNWIDAKTGAVSGEKEIRGGVQEISPFQQSPAVLWVHTKSF